MSRYFFNIIDGVDIIDNVGSELASLAEVKTEALKTAGELLKNGGKGHVWAGHEWRMTVVDERGRDVLVLRFSGELKPAA